MITLNDLPIDYIVYPGGEVSIKTLIGFDSECKIDAYIKNSNDLMAVLLLKDILDRINPYQKVVLHIPYFPYARQDRVIQGKVNNQSLSVKVLANLINAANFSEVIVVDPHSTVTPALIDRCTVISKLDLYTYNNILSSFGNNIALVAPDIGAYKSVSEIAEFYNVPIATAVKIRNPETGYLSIDSIHNIKALHKKDIIVIDDICDGGKTFELLADAISREDIIPYSLNLSVTHGIFSNGKERLESKYDRVHAIYDWTKI